MKPLAIDSTNITMESLALPEDLLYWDGKTEPISPLCNEFLLISGNIENWQLFDNNFANEISIDTEHLLKPGLHFSELLTNDNDLVIELCDLKKEHWNDTKFDSSPHILNESIGAVIPSPSPVTKVQNHAENNSFSPAPFDTATLTQLTPPQSPPYSCFSAQIIHQHVINEAPVSPLHSCSSSCESPELSDQYAWNGNNSDAATSKFFEEIEIERETQIVDEIVNTRAQELIDWHDESESMSSSSTPSMLSGTDEECLPNSPFMISSISSSSVHIDADCERVDLATTASRTKKRTRPYGRGIEDRKIRKKEQNKNAATRYRQKKKQEMEIVLSEEQQLTNRNIELKSVLADRNREARYLKTLIREFYKTKKH